MKAFLFYLFSFTWGIIMSAVGVLVTLVLLIAGKKPQRYRCAWYFVVGENWGGINLGPCSIVGKQNTYAITHEYGHAIQNCIFGPLFLVLVAIPSLTRCLYRDLFFAKTSDVFDALLILIVSILMFTLIACMFNMYAQWMWILFWVGIYITSMSIWIVYIEGARYHDNKFPSYDSIWFEGWATRLGNYFNK